MTAAAAEIIRVLELDPRAIVDSPLQYRKRDQNRGIEELTASIREKGLLQPVCVRPRPRGKFELVYGHRRKRAAIGAELKTISCIVRDLNDDEVVEAQLVENLDREDPHPLDEADGFQALIERNYTPQRIAEKIGHPVAYVVQRLKLCGLSQKARKALDENKISIGVAVLIAKLPDQKTQDKALEQVGGEFTDGQMSVADARALIEKKIMLVLGSAPFDRGDPNLVPTAGACTVCPKRTGNQAELFADVKSKDLCTDPPCYKSKLDALWQIRIKKHKADGGEVLNQKDSSDLLGRSSYGQRHNELRRQYRKLDDQEYVGRGFKKLKSLFGGELPPITLARDPDSGLPVQLVSAKDAEAVIRKAKGESNKAAKSKNKPNAAEQRRREEERRRGEIRRAVTVAVVAGVEQHTRSNMGTDFVSCHRDLVEGLVLAAAASVWAETNRKAADRRQMPESKRDRNLLRGPGYARIREWAKGKPGPELFGLLVELLAFRDSDNDGDTAYKRVLAAVDVDPKKVAAEVVAQAKSKGAAKKAPAESKAPAKAKPKPARGKKGKAKAKSARRARRTEPEELEDVDDEEE